jgi:hypothetical protein
MMHTLCQSSSELLAQSISLARERLGGLELQFVDQNIAIPRRRFGSHARDQALLVDGLVLLLAAGGGVRGRPGGSRFAVLASATALKAPVLSELISSCQLC